MLRALRLDVLSLYPRPGAGRFAAWGWLGRALWRALAAGGLTATGGTRRSRMLSQVLVAIIGMFFMGGIVYSAWGGGALCTAFPLRAAGNRLCALRPRRHLRDPRRHGLPRDLPRPAPGHRGCRWLLRPQDAGLLQPGREDQEARCGARERPT